MMRRYLFVWIILAAVLVFGPLVQAAESEKADNIVDKSRIVVQEMMRTDAENKAVPLDLLRQASGIAIIPGMLKGGFVIGGSYGKGVVLKKSADSWAGPAFISMTAGSLGLQIGGQSIDLLLVIVGEKAMNAFMQNKFKLGADVGLAAGPLGGHASAATEITLKGGIYSYSRSKGAFAGVSIEGAGISSQPDLNKAYYGSTGSTPVILAGKVSPPASGQELIATLNKYR
jgi:lipid-binding SYLF domain-containing protein